MAKKPDEDSDPFAIDDRDLKGEWERQSTLARRVGRAEADARHAHAQAKARLNVTAARVRYRIRRDPERYGLAARPTKDDVDMAVELDPEYQKAVAEADLAKRDVDYFTADVTAAVDRRKALENIVKLLDLEYWSDREPRVSRPVPRDRDRGYTDDDVP